MKIYKPKFTFVLKSYFLNMVASFVFLVIIANFIDLLYGFIATFFLYSYLMYLTFIKDRTYFLIEGNYFRKIQGKKQVFEYNIKDYNVKKELNKGFIGYADMNILLGNHIINCQMLDLGTFEQLFRDLSQIK